MAQHWVPQYVLRGFSADGKTIWQYDKTGRLPPTKVGIKGACGRNDAFSAPVERLLSTIETATNPAIEALRGMDHAMRISPIAKRIVAVYLTSFMSTRSPAIRDQQVADANEADFLDWAQSAAKHYGAPSSPNRDLLPTLAAKAAGDVNGLMAGHWDSFTFQRWLFYSMSWVVLQCAEPIVTIPDGGLIRLGDRGLLDPKAEFYFPLSANRVLLASWHGAPDVVEFLPASPAHMRNINKHGFGQSGRFVYGQEHSNKVAEMVLRPSHHFPNLQRLKTGGGPNPTVKRLEDLDAWFKRVCDGDSDSSRHWCMGPGAGDRNRHSWPKAPFGLALASDTPEIKVSFSICEWCGALERRYPNGQLGFDDLELRRTTMSDAKENWWQMFNVVATQNRIGARGQVPIYRIVVGDDEAASGDRDGK